MVGDSGRHVGGCGGQGFFHGFRPLGHDLGGASIEGEDAATEAKGGGWRRGKVCVLQ